MGRTPSVKGMLGKSSRCRDIHFEFFFSLATGLVSSLSCEILACLVQCLDS